MKIKVLKLLATASGKDDTRDYLNSVAISSTELVASNGHVLCHYKPHNPCEIMDLFDFDFSELIDSDDTRYRFMIDIKTINLFLKLVKSAHGKKGDDLEFRIIKSGNDFKIETINVSVLSENKIRAYPDFSKALAFEKKEHGLRATYNMLYLSNAQVALNEYFKNDKYKAYNIYESEDKTRCAFFESEGTKAVITYVIMPCRV